MTMAAVELSMGTAVRNNEAPLKEAWIGELDELETPSGGGAFDEIVYIDTRGANKISISITEKQGEAGTAKYYGILDAYDDIDPTDDGVIINNDAGIIGESAGYALVASGTLTKTFDGPYEAILVCIAKTAAGAQTDHTRIRALKI